MPSVLIVGATSPVAIAIAQRFANEGHSLILAGRDADRVRAAASRLESTARDEIRCEQVDVECDRSLADFVSRFEKDCPDIVISVLGRQLSPAHDRAAQFPGLVAVNLTAPSLLLERFAALMVKRAHGSLIGISSVVGDRGRGKNYPYGAAKAGFNAYLSGLRQRLTPMGVQVMTVKPGVVDDPDKPATHPRWMITTADRVADDVFKGWKRGSAIVYTPGFWRWIMLMVRLVPEFLFRRLSF